MRYAVLADVHGNRRALAAVLEAAAAAGYDELVCLGDVAHLGSDPSGCVDELRAQPTLRMVQGNTDRYLAERRDDPALRWCADRLGADRLGWLERLPTRQVLEDEIDALCVHATPGSDEEAMLPSTPLDELAKLLGGVEQRLVLGGHVHVQYRRQLSGLVVANPGSVGLPFDGDQRAAWALVDEGVVELHRTAYAVADELAAVAASDHPAAALIARRLRSAAP
jgi:putative phosphoesterase